MPFSPFYVRHSSGNGNDAKLLLVFSHGLSSKNGNIAKLLLVFSHECSSKNEHFSILLLINAQKLSSENRHFTILLLINAKAAINSEFCTIIYSISPEQSVACDTSRASGCVSINTSPRATHPCGAFLFHGEVQRTFQ